MDEKNKSIGSVRIAGITPKQAEEKITGMYIQGDFYRQPDVLIMRNSKKTM